MANSVRIMPPTDPASSDRAQAQTATRPGFDDALAAQTHALAPGRRHATHPRGQAGHAPHAPHGASHAHVAHGTAAQARGATAHAPPHHAHARPARAEKTAAVIPDSVQHALTQAMRLEQVPESWRAGLQFIMAQESAGRVGARNHVDTARGLFQLTRASYGLNPNGAGSFGNALEEAQGGIRYIRERYGTADNAAGFWQRRRWY